MITKYHKLALTASITLAMALIFSCSTDDPNDGNSSNSGGGTSSLGGGNSSGGTVAGDGSSSSGGLTGNSGVFTDLRDNKSYNWVKIGEQIWMTRDLNYDIPSNSSDVCYENKPDNCDKYGRLYTFADAKNVCPPGWDMPKKSDWQTLIDNLGGFEVAGEKLKAKNTEFTKWNGTDEFNFNALPSGLQYANGTFGYIGNKGIWWGSSGNGNNEIFEDHFALNSNDKKATIEKCGTPSNKHTVRCIYVNPGSGSSSSAVTVVSSSSKAQTGPCTAANNTSTQYCSNGTMKTYGATPAIGGRTYKTVEIGTQVWMAENLASGTGVCYDDNTDNCAKYGMLYDLGAAVCPSGWHVSTSADWDRLLRYVDDNNGGDGFEYNGVYWSTTAGKYLKAISDWNEGNGEDKYGFAALPGGSVNFDGYFDGLVNYFGYWWTATNTAVPGEDPQISIRYMWYYDPTFYGEAVNAGEIYPIGDKLSVRCVKD